MAAEYVESAVVTDFSTVPSATCVYQFNYKTDTRYVMYQFWLNANESISILYDILS